MSSSKEKLSQSALTLNAKSSVKSRLKSPALKRFVKNFTITFAILLGLALVSNFAAPRFIKPAIENELSSTLGRKVSINEIHLNLFKLSASVDGFTLYAANQQDKVLQIQRIFTQASINSLWRLAPVIKQIQIEKPIAKITRTAPGRYDFQDIVEKLANLPKPEKNASNDSRFSLNNISLVDGEIQLKDISSQSTHQLKAIQLGIPFLSNMPYAAEIFTEPTLSAKIDDAPFSIKGKTLPFSSNYRTQVQIDMDGVDLAELKGLIPNPYPIILKSALLDTRLQLEFSQKGSKQDLSLNGTINLRKLNLEETKVSGEAAKFVAIDEVQATLNEMRPLEKQYTLKSLIFKSPNVHIARLADGKFNFQRAFQSNDKEAKSTASEKVKSSDTTHISIEHAEIDKGHFIYDDLCLHPKLFHYVVEEINAKIDQFDNNKDQSAHYSIHAQTTQNETLTHEGALNLVQKDLTGRIEFKNFAPQFAQPYFEKYFLAKLDKTKVDGNFPYQVNWRDNLSITTNDASLHISELQLHLPTDKTPQQSSITAKSAEVKGIDFDLQKQLVNVKNISLIQPKFNVLRDEQGNINLLSALPKTDEVTSASTPKTPTLSNSKKEEKSWQVQIKQAGLSNAEINFSDATLAKLNGGEAAVQHIRNANLAIEYFAWPFNAKSAPLNVSADLQHAAQNKKWGKLQTKGTIQLEPFSTQLALDIHQLDLLAVQPYVTSYINAKLMDGALDTKGNLQLTLPTSDQQHKAAPQISYAGNANLTHVKADSKLTQETLAKWNDLSLTKLNVQVNEPVNAPLAISIEQINLKEFFAKILLDEQGQLNLQKLLVSDTNNSKAGAANSVPKVVSSVTSNPAENPVSPRISLGDVTLQKGSINFTDHYIKPNYNANLRSIEGTITKVSSFDPQPADVKVIAKLNDQSPIQISGKVNPFKTQLFLDLQAKASGIELSNFTPYSTKYTGYPITKGKLNVDVNYKIDQGKLSAENGIFIDQLTFGEKVESPSATNLPVRLAVSLLTNSRGEIDIHLPISGSLSDPQFSIGGLVWQVLGNLISKAVTAPFSLLAGLAGGGEELSHLDFSSGESKLTPSASKQLDTLAKILIDKPSLKLEIIGRIDPDLDLTGVQDVYINRKLKLAKRKQLGSAQQNIALDTIQITPAERNVVLAQAYKDEAFTKPKNFIGFNKSLPPAEMEKLMRAHAISDANVLQKLAQARALTIKKYLLEQSKIPEERLFIVAPQLGSERPEPKVKAPRVDFSLK